MSVLKMFQQAKGCASLICEYNSETANFNCSYGNDCKENIIKNGGYKHHGTYTQKEIIFFFHCLGAIDTKQTTNLHRWIFTQGTHMDILSFGNSTEIHLTKS
jgi:hypothetical protein